MNPVLNIDEILADPQFAFRDYWVEVPHLELGESLTYAGAPYKFSKTLWQIVRRAPLIGEHNDQIYGEQLGFSSKYMAELKTKNII